MSEHCDLIDQYFPNGIILDSKENEDAMWDKFFPPEMATQLKAMNNFLPRPVCNTNGDNK